MRSFKAKLLHGHSLIEVIISTIIILTTFMLFSFLLGQLMSSRRIAPETLLLLKLGSLTEKETVDTTTVKECYKNIDIDFSLDPALIEHLKITDNSTRKMIFQYYFINRTEEANSIYSK